MGVAVDKVSRCVAIPALSAIREWHGQAGVSCAAKSFVSFLCKKGLLYMGFAQYSSPFYLLSHCTCQSAGNRRGSCRFSLRPSREKSSSAKPTGLTELQKLKSVVTPALLAAPAHSRCSGTCRWSSAQRSGHTPLQWRRCSGGSCTAQCLPDAWGAWAAPYGQPCRSR